MSDFDLSNCRLCPHKCGVNRFETTGFCGTTAQPVVSSICLHKGEEPLLSGSKGVCNVFFAHCNLQCTYCQNHQISRNNSHNQSWIKSVDDVVNTIIPYLDEGIRMLGFVSPSHQVSQMVDIIDGLRCKGYAPTVIYNTNCYDCVDTLKTLEDIVNVYLPDFKYINNTLAFKYSGVNDYFEVATLALREMYRQKGSSLLLGDDGLVESGLIIRHLVLPSHVNESIELLRFLSYEFSPRLYVSLMSQYYPPKDINPERPLNRVLHPTEYQKVLDVMDEIGFRGWLQALDSHNHYQPDFSSDNPFSP